MGFLLKLITGNPALIWIAAAIAVASGALGASGAWTVQGYRLDAAKAALTTFKVETKAAGDLAEAARQKDISDRKAISDKQEANNAKRYATLDSRYRAAVAAARLPSVNSGGSEAKPLSSAAAVLSCPDRQPDVAGWLADLEVGILALLERGDRAIERTVTCKAWLDEQVSKP